MLQNRSLYLLTLRRKDLLLVWKSKNRSEQASCLTPVLFSLLYGSDTVSMLSS